MLYSEGVSTSSVYGSLHPISKDGVEARLCVYPDNTSLPLLSKTKMNKMDIRLTSASRTAETILGPQRVDRKVACRASGTSGDAAWRQEGQVGEGTGGGEQRWEGGESW